MNVLVTLHDGPYGTEKAFNALRLIKALQAGHGAQAHLFLLSDAVTCAMPHQQRPEGASNIEAMLNEVIANGAKVTACMTCVDARGLGFMKLIEGVEIGSMVELAAATVEADRVLCF